LAHARSLRSAAINSRSHRHLSNIDYLTACTACLVCFISTVNEKRRTFGRWELVMGT
jgi:hypothetical protein